MMNATVSETNEDSYIDRQLLLSSVNEAEQSTFTGVQRILISDRAGAVFEPATSDIAMTYPVSAKFQDATGQWWILELNNPYLEHLGALLEDDSYSIINDAIALSKAHRVLFSCYSSSHFTFTDTLDFSNLMMDAKNARFHPNFSGKPAIILGDTCRVSNIYLEPTESHSRGVGYPDFGDENTPRDDVSHGFKIVGRVYLKNVEVRNCRGNGFHFEVINGNDSSMINLRSYYNNYGFYFASNPNDNFSICNGDLRAYGNAGSGIFSRPDSYIRMNTLFIRSEHNNHGKYANIDGSVCDVVLDHCIHNQLIVYSEGTQSLIDYNIYCTDNATRNSVYSLRQDRDRITGSNAALSGNRLWQNSPDDIDALDLASSTGNIYNSSMYVKLRRASQVYGYLAGVDGGLYLSSTKESKEIGVDTKGIRFGETHIVKTHSLRLTESNPENSIVISSLIPNTVITGRVELNFLNSRYDHIRRVVTDFTSTGATVKINEVTNILTGNFTYSEYLFKILEGDLLLNIVCPLDVGDYMKVEVKMSWQRF